MDKIIITRSMHPFVAKKLSIHHNVWQNTSSSPITRKELLKRMARCNGLLCTPYDVIDSEIIDAAPDLRTISTFSVGYDHIDVKYAKSRNISIGYTPDVLSEATANMAFALILDITRGVSHGDRIIRSDKWKSVFAPQDLCGIELSGRKHLAYSAWVESVLLWQSVHQPLSMKITYHTHRFSRHRRFCCYRI